MQTVFQSFRGKCVSSDTSIFLSVRFSSDAAVHMHIQCIYIYIDVRRTYSYNFIATEIISRNYSMPRLTTLAKSKAGFPSMMSGDLADVVVNLHSGSIIGIAIYICMGQA